MSGSLTSPTQTGCLPSKGGRRFGEHPEVITARGESVTLLRSKYRSRWTGGALTIEKVKRNYLVTPTSQVPLEAALLHWHLILEDWAGKPVGGGGGG